MLTNAEIQEIIRQVNAGEYSITDALNDIARASKGEDVRKALYAEAYTLNKEGHAGVTDFEARQTAAQIAQDVNAKIAELTTDTDDRLAVMEAQINNVIGSGGQSFAIDTLWEGNINMAGETAELSHSIDDYLFLIITFKFSYFSDIQGLYSVAAIESNNMRFTHSIAYNVNYNIQFRIDNETKTIVTIDKNQRTRLTGQNINTWENDQTGGYYFSVRKIEGVKLETQTADTEVQDIHIGSDGTEYPTAGDAVRAQIRSIQKTLFDNLKISKIGGFVADKYINTNVNTGGVVSLAEQSSNGYSYAIVECETNEKIMVNGTGGNNPRLWAFVDSNYKLLSKSDAAAQGVNLVVVAPQNARYCIINSEKNSLGACYKTPDLDGIIGAIISNSHHIGASSIPSGADLNDYTTPGNYYVATTAIANSLSNAPINQGGRLIVMTINSDLNIFQFYISVKGVVYTREKDNNGWSEWSTKTRSLDLKFEDASSIPSDADLNDYATAGNFYVSTTAIANSLVNAPVKQSGRLIVMTLNSALNIYQIYISVKGKFFAREKDANGWSEWSSNTDFLNLKFENSSSIPSDADLDDYTATGNYYVSTTAIARSLVHAPRYMNGNYVNSSGRLIVMTINSGLNIFQAYISVKGEIFTRERDGRYWSFWEKKASEADTAIYASRASYNAMQALIAQSDYNIAFANAYTPLTLKNYLGNTQNVHPKVLYFENGFGGHKYWMVYTPYPHSDDIYENPCVAYSDDGYAWKNISGNPLDEAVAPNYNSDGHLVYRPDTGVLELWYRYFERETEIKTIYRRTSTDGVTWTQREAIKTFSAAEDCASPAILWDGSQYLVWGVSAGTAIDFYTISPSNMNEWTLVRTLNTQYYDGGTRVYPWHIDVIKDGDMYILLAMTKNSRQVSDGVWSLFIATSADNVDYGTPVKVVGGADGWDKYMYRSSIVKVGNKYRIYYSACSSQSNTSIYNNAHWGIGITESDMLLSGYIGKYE